MKLGKNTYKLRDNLFIEKDLVISYETVVAQITKDGIQELGRYSRTTTKHIHLISSLTGLPIIKYTGKKCEFDKFEMGVKCDCPNAVSPKTTKSIFSLINDGVCYGVAISMLKPKMSKRDWELLDKEGVDTEVISGSTLLARLSF